MGTTQTGDGMLKMNETCDRCGPAVGAVYCVTRGGELYFCESCASRLWPALSAQGWASTVALRAAGRARAGPWSAFRAAWCWFSRAGRRGSTERRGHGALSQH
jgi:hypothetical protein